MFADCMVRRASQGDMYYANEVTKATMNTNPPELDPVRTSAAEPPQLSSRTNASPAAMSAIGEAPNSTGSTTVHITPLPSGSNTTVSAKETILEQSKLKVGASVVLASPLLMLALFVYTTLCFAILRSSLEICVVHKSP